MAKKKEPALTQQEFLRNAMRRLDMTRDEFTERIGTKRRTLDKWLLPSESNDFREMPDIVWKFVGEILKAEAKID